jgi:YHS domain-containing protein
MLVTLIAAMTMAPQEGPKFVCPVVPGDALPANAKAVEWNGAKFMFCCPGCEPKFTREPMKYIKERAEAGQLAGQFLFDPVTGDLLNMRRAKFHMAFKGINYSFTKEENFNTFKANPAKFATMPEKEVMTCPVMGEKVASYGEASAYVDFQGVRYYTCCAGCNEPLRKDPAKYAKDWAAKATAPVVRQPKAAE